MQADSFKNLIIDLVNLPRELEWVEFKHNNQNPDEIGEYISALSNSATLHQQPMSYIVWGVDDDSHDIIGTNFKPRDNKVGDQEIENYLSCLLSPKVDFRIHEIEIKDVNIVLITIPAANGFPVGFKGTEYIRVGSYTNLR